MRTISCIVCGSKEITRSTGHVHDANEKIIASFCNEHKNIGQLNTDCKGCYGHWRDWMGKESFGQVCYIDSKAV